MSRIRAKWVMACAFPALSVWPDCMLRQTGSLLAGTCCSAGVTAACCAAGLAARLPPVLLHHAVRRRVYVLLVCEVEKKLQGVWCIMNCAGVYMYFLCREEELPELETLIRSGASPIKALGGVESKQGKANVLIQVRSCVDSNKQPYGV